MIINKKMILGTLIVTILLITATLFKPLQTRDSGRQFLKNQEEKITTSVMPQLPEKEIFILSCEGDCPPETKSTILSTADATLKALQKEFPWMSELNSTKQYFIQINLSNSNNRSYADYDKREIELNRVYKPTIAHEVAHLLIAEYFGIDKNPLLEGVFPKGPSWLQEGLAMHLEYLIDDSRRDENIRLVMGQPLETLDEFESGTGIDQKKWYAHSAGMVEFLLNKGGKERFKLLTDCVEQKLPPVIVERDSWEECFDSAYNEIFPSWESFYYNDYSKAFRLE